MVANMETNHDIAVGDTEQNEDDYHTRQDRIVLNVGGRRFETFRNTLIAESAYFAACLSETWKGTDSFDPVDGSYFIDLDPDVFQHVLNYLRLSNFPVFYNEATNAFDYGRYSAVLAQARYLKIPRLVEWIEKKKYLAAVEFRYASVMARGDDAFDQIAKQFGAVQGNSKVEFHPIWDAKKVHVCPLGIAAHRLDPNDCINGTGRYINYQWSKCPRSGTGPFEYEIEHVFKVLAVKSEVVYHEELMGYV